MLNDYFFFSAPQLKRDPLGSNDTPDSRGSLTVLSVFGKLFIPQPWLALIPGALFLGLYRLSHRRLAGAAAFAWLLYAPYEYAMHRRWLCSGECNIRVDLLLLYPLLILLSLAAVLVVVRNVLRRQQSG